MKSWYATEDGLAVWLGLIVVAWRCRRRRESIYWAGGGHARLGRDREGGAAGFQGYAGLPAARPDCHLRVYAGTRQPGCVLLGLELRKFVSGLHRRIYWVSILCWLVGHYAYIAQTPKAGGDGNNLVAGPHWRGRLHRGVTCGAYIGNFLPGLAAWLKEAARPELFIKTAIVILGASLGVKAAGATGLVSAIMFRGLAAIIEAYLIYWALVYFIARKYFKFSREWAAPLASGISICGVSAAITTGAARRGR